MAAHGTAKVDLETGNHRNGGEEVDREMGHREREIFHQVELYADEENDSPEIKRKKRMARAALMTWKEKTEMCEQRILQSKSEMRSIMNEVYQLVGLYSVFEGVVLTAVATSSRLVCQHLWSPVGLSLFAYSLLVDVAFKKFRNISNLEETKDTNKSSLRNTQLQISKLRTEGYAYFDFDRDCTSTEHPVRSAPSWRSAFGLIVPLTIFTAGLVFSLVHILCWS